tara:strand:+ start:225 stop:488 length:264 start_codon:yes stop_codon:yes gene_type:complete
MDNIRLNIAFRSTSKWKDSQKRTEHVFDRMQSRGIGRENIIEAVRKGAKKIRKDGSVITEFRWFRVVYREFNLKGIRKIYPITVIEA